MCGIAGAFRKDGIDMEKMKKATDTMYHRGPDAGGYYISPDAAVFLGHRRLSIIDLSVTANQPMASSDGRYEIVYNGEIYNFMELRHKLPGFSWHTSGDTEVILELFAAFGKESFSWLNGIFSFGIYDTLKQQLWLCRDQLGIKPLFIQKQEGQLLFASELKMIIAAGGQQEINKASIPYFLHLGYIPEPLTIYKEIEKFPSAHYACFDIGSGSWEQKKYWDGNDHYLKPQSGDEATLLKMYREKLFAAVERQMISDVPLGTFLSGGIDSSLVTAVAAQVNPGKVKSFSIGFEEAAFDESQYAGQVAKHLNTEHHLFKVKLDDVLQLVPDFMSVYDEPFADSSAFPTMLVSRLARKHVTVALSGDGGDEFFQGYGMYAWAERLNDPKVRLMRKPLHLVSKLMKERYQRAGKLFDYKYRSNIPSHIFSQEQYMFSEKELGHLLSDPGFDFREFNRLPGKGSAREQQAFWDMNHYLKDDLLVKVDRASMRYSLETRVPLLDQELVNFALGVPLSLKIKEGYGTKYMMKQVLYDLVPRTIFERPKRGFAIPLNKWLGNELKPLLDKYLNAAVVTEAGLVHGDHVADVLQQYQNGKTYLYNRVWVLLVLHWWYCEQYKKQ